MSNANRLRKGLTWVGVILLLVGGFGSLLTGSITATTIMAISLASALLLLDLAGKPAPRSARAMVGFGLLAVAVGSALVMVYELVSK